MTISSFRQEAIIGDSVEFIYSGKVRVGKVELIADWGVKLDCGNGIFKSFNYQGISGLRNLTVVD